MVLNAERPHESLRMRRIVQPAGNHAPQQMGEFLTDCVNVLQLYTILSLALHDKYFSDSIEHTIWIWYCS